MRMWSGMPSKTMTSAQETSRKGQHLGSWELSMEETALCTSGRRLYSQFQASLEVWTC